MAAAQAQERRRPEQLAGTLEPRPHLLEQRLRPVLRRAGDDHANEVPERRVAELASARQLVGEESRHVVARSELERTRVRLEALDDHLPRRVAPATPGELRHELERALLGAEVR